MPMTAIPVLLGDLSTLTKFQGMPQQVTFAPNNLFI